MLNHIYKQRTSSRQIYFLSKERLENTKRNYRNNWNRERAYNQIACSMIEERKKRREIYSWEASSRDRVRPVPTVPSSGHQNKQMYNEFFARLHFLFITFWLYGATHTFRPLAETRARSTQMYRTNCNCNVGLLKPWNDTIVISTKQTRLQVHS